MKDDGVGISPEMLPRLFEIFSQEERALERSQGGLGVGLSLVRASWGFTAGVSRRRATGSERGASSPSTCRSSPRARPSRVPRVGTEGARGRRQTPGLDRRRRADSADSLAVILAMKGHETHAAYDGEEAMTAAARLRPDVVILDIRMPKRNGYEACRWIREQPWGRRSR